MSEKTISYLDRTYGEFKNDIIDKSRKYYNDIFQNYNDAAIGTWLIDVFADIADTLSYNIDRTYQETGIDSANTRSSLLQMARSNGLKIPGPKSAVVEVEISCTLPVNNSANLGDVGNDLSSPDWSYCPYIKKGSLFSTGSKIFELYEDVDFASQFDSNGIPNRRYSEIRNSNGIITGYRVSKISVAVAGQSRIYKKYISQNDIVPFMSLTIDDTDVTNVESIIVKQGMVSSTKIGDFYPDRESFEGSNGLPVQRYFEVENLIDQYRFGYDEEVSTSDDGASVIYSPSWETVDSLYVDGTEVPIRIAARGKWKRVKNKFITEFLDNGSLKVTFGPGIRNKYGEIPSDASMFTQYMMSRMEANDYMGVLPEPNTTVFVLYHIGGGDDTNIAAGAINSIVSIAVDIPGNCNDPLNARKKSGVRSSITVTNTTPSYGGKNAPSNEELRWLIKYNSGAQNRCVTLKDYYSMISHIEPKFGIPFRYNVVEENNKVVVYCLGLDYNGHLTDMLSEVVADNIREYLSKYKMINDCVEVRSGKVINISFEVDVFIDKSYEKSDVVKQIIDTVYGYMDIRSHMIGEDIFIGDIEKEISKLDGVKNLIQLRVYNRIGGEYSDTMTTQDIVTSNDCGYEEALAEGDDVTTPNMKLINLSRSDKTLYGNDMSMYEVKYKEKDIIVNVKTR